MRVISQPSAPVALVIEDDPDAAEIASGMLQMLGFAVEHCAVASDALRFLEQEVPDLILLDIRLPDIGGVDLLDLASRTQPGPLGVPVIAVSALDLTAAPLASSLRARGVEVLLPKPYGLAELEQAVRQVFPLGTQGRTQPSAASGRVRLMGTARVLDREFSIEVIGGGSSHLEVHSAELPLPEGESITLTLKRRAPSGDRSLSEEIRILAHVATSSSVDGGWRATLQVAAARPSAAYTRVTELLQAGTPAA